MNMRTYHGWRDADHTAKVIVIEDSGKEHPLNLRLDLRNHSPTGPEWGYSGSGPAQLALAILCDALGDDERAQRLYQMFKFKVIAGLDRDQPWTMKAHAVRMMAHIIEQERNSHEPFRHARSQADRDSA
jgi:hypothetical protein